MRHEEPRPDPEARAQLRKLHGGPALAHLALEREREEPFEVVRPYKQNFYRPLGPRRIGAILAHAGNLLAPYLEFLDRPSDHCIAPAASFDDSGEITGWVGLYFDRVCPDGVDTPVGIQVQRLTPRGYFRSGLRLETDQSGTPSSIEVFAGYNGVHNSSGLREESGHELLRLDAPVSHTYYTARLPVVTNSDGWGSTFMEDLFETLESVTPALPKHPSDI